MNDTLAPVRSLDSDTLLHPAATNTTHLSLAARLELRLGLWLLLRSARRLDSARDHAEQARVVTNARLLAARHHAALRAHALNGART
jgi:hypothetical protein